MVKALQKIIGTSEKDLSRHLLLLKSRAKSRQRAGQRFEQGCQVLEIALSPTSSSHAGVEADGNAAGGVAGIAMETQSRAVAS